ncbi:MAG: GNAT family N-acetyltransferase [Clostridia bacterium]|nr:GNAT family N-acetyltransferase [Clostridia bacterium]
MDIESRDENLVNEILGVYEKSIEHLNGVMPKESMEEIKSNTEKMIKNIENLIIVKNDEENIIGFMGCENENLEMLYLHPDYKNQGIGKELINIAINNHNVNKAHIVKINTDGIDFCRHMGFIPCEITNGSLYNEAIEMKLNKEAN